MKIESVAIDSIHGDPANVRTHPERNLAVIKASLARFGQQKPIVVDAAGVVRAGNGTLEAARSLEWKTIQVVRTPLKGSEATAYAIADNRSSELAEWDETGLAEQLRSLQSEDFDLDAVGYTDDEVGAIIDGLAKEMVGGDNQASGRSLAERFGVPPMSVLDARQGYWQDRKRYWIESGVAESFGQTDGRAANLIGGTGFDGSWQRSHGIKGCHANSNGTSIFDPVLCELAYRWFVPPGGSVLDPFAGGAVRGMVAANLGYSYTGVDLRPEQVEANRVSGESVPHEIRPRWVVGDSRDISVLSPGDYDFVFSCPPYGDLERYSDDPSDLSTLDYLDFLAAYRQVIAASVSMLKPNRFACFVVGDFRDRKGFYRNFVSDTIAAFRDAGAALYNEAVLLTMVGGVALRVAKQFNASRKLGKTHQNVLVFYRGDPKRISLDFGEAEFGESILGGEQAGPGVGVDDDVSGLVDDGPDIAE